MRTSSTASTELLRKAARIADVDPMDGRSPVGRCMQYAADAESGCSLVCEKTRMASARFLGDLERSQDPDYPWRFDTRLANRPVEFIEKFLCIVICRFK